MYSPGAIKRSFWVLGSWLILACAGSPSDGTPTGPGAISLNGTYAGPASDNTGPGTLTWVLAQSGSKVTGTVTLVAGSITGHGTVSGTLSASTLTFTISIPAGGLPFPYATCEINVSGTATGVTSTSISGTYTGNNSCTGGVSGGTFNLVRK